MERAYLRFTGAIIVTLLLAFVLSIVPIKEEWVLWRPEWMALTLIHWALYMPKKSSLILAWFVGLLVDALQGSILGQHAFGFALVVLMTFRIRPHILVDSFSHQLFVLFIVLGTYLHVNLWILGITGNSPAGWGYWLTVASSIIIWPIYNYFLCLFHGKKKSFS